MFRKYANCRGICRLQTLLVIALSHVASDASKKMLAVNDELSEGDLQRNDSSVFVEAGQFNAFPRDVPLPGFDISAQAMLVDVPQIFGHEHGHRLADHIANGMAKNAFDCGVYEDNLAVFVDRDDRIGCGFGDDTKRCVEFRGDIFHLELLIRPMRVTGNA